MRLGKRHNQYAMKPTRQLLGERIKELRKSRKMSQEALAEKIDVDPKHVSRIEVGKSYPSLDTLEQIALALGVELKEMFEFAHLHARADLTKDLHLMLKEADDEKLKTAARVLRAILR